MKIFYTIPILLAATLTAQADTQPQPEPTPGPQAQDPKSYLTQPLPQQWLYLEGLQQTLPSEDQWWRQFDDKTLSSLIKKGEENNFDVRAALHRIEAAKGVLTQTRAAYYPTLSLNAGYTRERTSGVMESRHGKAMTDGYFTLGANLSWEIDIFGKVTAKAKASKADFKASEAEYLATQVSMAASIAKTYINLRLYQAELAIAQSHLESQQKVLKITQARMDAGIGNKLEVSQARQVYLSTSASIPALKASIDASLNSLALLVGVYPEELQEELSHYTPMPILMESPCCGNPSQLLRRRPDILQSEQQLAAAAALVGVSKKDFLPTLSINASISTDAHNAGDLFSKPSLGYSIAPQLSWNLFEGFARKGAVAEAKANMEEAIDNYNLAVHTAVEEVNSAISATRHSMESISLYLQFLNQTRETMTLSLDLYKKGLTQFTNVVDAQISVLQAENSLVESKAQSLIDAITLYEALGGGY